MYMIPSNPPRIRVPKFPNRDQEVDVAGLSELLEECGNTGSRLAEASGLADGRAVLEPIDIHVTNKQRNRRLNRCVRLGRKTLVNDSPPRASW